MTSKKNALRARGKATNKPERKSTKMANGKFAALAEINKDTPKIKRGRAREPGMRSKPEYRQFSHYMRRDTHHAIHAILHERNDGTTLSDLIDQLLGKWLEAQPETRAKR